MVKTFFVLASGQSLNSADVEKVQTLHSEGLCGVVAVSNVALDLAPWADALVSNDAAWWNTYLKHADFKGQKFSGQTVGYAKRIKPPVSSCNSGLLALHVAHMVLGAETVYLLGLDMWGTHYFGKHLELKNPGEKQFNVHVRQFSAWSKQHKCEVVNLNPNSRLRNYPFDNLDNVVKLLREKP